MQGGTLMATQLENAVATWIIDQLQIKIDLYFGTGDTKDEVTTRGIGLYEKNTFRLLLKYYAFKLLRQRDEELQRLGRVHLSDEEISSILTLVNVAVNNWIKKWVWFTKQYPYIRISDITGKRSKVIPWVEMSEKIWTDTKAVVNSLASQFRERYTGFCIYPSLQQEQKEQLQAAYPNFQFVAVDDITIEFNTLLENQLNDDVDIGILLCYVKHVMDNLYDIADTTIEDEQIQTNHKKIVKQKRQDFVDYVTQQVFGEKGYFYGNKRENVALAISQNNYPGITDFTNFMNARAVTEAYYNYGMSDANGNIYDSKDVAEVIRFNKKYIKDVAVQEYIQRLVEADVPVNKPEIGKAFGYDIPNEENLLEISDLLTDKTLDIKSKADNSFYSSFSQNDFADWCNNLKNYSDEISSERKIDTTFTEPLVEAATNVLGVMTKNVVIPDNNLNKVSSTYSDKPVTRDSNRFILWRAYYPAGISDVKRLTNNKVTDNNTPNSDTDRIYGWKRYYGGDTDDRNKNVNRTYDFTRYYPGIDDDSQLNDGRTEYFRRWYQQQGEEPTRVAIGKGYYPSNTSTETRVANWSRFYPGQGQVATDFLPTYRTFSGHDMVVTVQVPVSNKVTITKVIGAFQTISYSIHNEKHPVRVLGNMNAKGYVFGPRMVAGSIVLTVFDRHWMRELFNEYTKVKSETERYFLIDELPAIDITISCANEYGHNAKLVIYGITFVNEGQIMSINDVYTENTYEFFALNVDYLDRVEVTYANQKNKRLNMIPVETVTSSTWEYRAESVETLPDEPAAITTIPTFEERVPMLENVDSLDSSKQDKKAQEVLDKYKNNEMKQDKAIKKLQEIRDNEAKDLFKQWVRDVYDPQYKDMLSSFGVNKSTLKNREKLKEQLGSEYQTFSDILAAYEQAYSNVQQMIQNDTIKKYNALMATITVNAPSQKPEKSTETTVEETGDIVIFNPNYG